jgi:hypothetical protein
MLKSFSFSRDVNVAVSLAVLGGLGGTERIVYTSLAYDVGEAEHDGDVLRVHGLWMVYTMAYRCDLCTICG